MTEDPLRISAFIREMANRFAGQAALDEDSALLCAVAALEFWEDAEEPVELTKNCAHAIVDEDLSNWDSA
jgi:hypothetical protein